MRAISALWVCSIVAWGAPTERTIVRMPMRDGVRLSANVYRPAGSTRLPVLLVRTPYGKGQDLLPGYQLFIDHGYAVVVQDVRGRGQSDGKFRPLHQEMNDGADTLSWIAQQPWSDGRVGMLGGSYLGIVQWKAAITQHPTLRTIAPVVAGYDEYLDRFYSRGGAMKLGHRLSWIASNLRSPVHRAVDFGMYVSHLPLRTADRAATGRVIDFWQDAVNHPARDNWWKAISTKEQLGRITIPAFIVGGWYDNFVESDLEAFTELTRLSTLPHRIVIGPWPHNMSQPFTTMNYGRQSMVPLRRMQLDWFNQWVRGIVPPAVPPPVRIFVMGENRWREEREWPLARTRYTAWYLGPGGTLGALPASGSQPDRYVYDPRRPVPTRGGALCCNPAIFPWGPMDQRPLESRKDVLVYSSEPLADDVEVTGPVRGVLWVATSAPDTDFTVKLVDVYPDGRAINLCDGILRLRYRTSLTRAVLAKPGEVYRIVIQAGVTSNVFRAGHRIRIEVSSSNFPRFDRNPNTGTAIADERQLRTATQTIYHGRARPSHILLPVIPRPASAPSAAASGSLAASSRAL